MYIIKQWQGENFTLHAAQDIKGRVGGIIEQMKMDSDGKELELEHRVWDIESMYPSMPKADMIRSRKTLVATERRRVWHIRSVGSGKLSQSRTCASDGRQLKI